MSDRALVRLAPLCLFALGCRPEPAAMTEPQPAPDPGGPTVRAEPEIEPEPDADVEATPEPDAPEPEPALTADASDPEPDAQPDGGASEPAPAASKTAQREPLPKPIHAPGDGSCIKKFDVGSKVKGFRLRSLAGDKTISPAGYRNRVMLLNFWATWCKPCLEELPEFDRLYRKYRRHGLTLVAVTTDEDPKPIQDFVDKHKLVAKIALSGEEAAGAYDRPGFPFSFVVDGDGTIVAAFEFVNDACLGDLEQVIRESLENLD